MTRILILLSCVAVMLGATVWFASAGGAWTDDLEIAELQPLTPVGQPHDAPSLAVSVEHGPRSREKGAPSRSEVSRTSGDGVQIEPNDPSPEPDGIKLPVGGRLVVRITDAFGNPILSERRASVSRVSAKRWSGTATPREYSGEAAGPGVTVFPRLVTGRRYRA